MPSKKQYPDTLQTPIQDDSFSWRRQRRSVEYLPETLIENFYARSREEASYTAHGSLRELFDNQADELLVAGPAGTGKSRACLQRIHQLASDPRYHGARFLIVRKTRESASESALVTFEEHVLTPGTEMYERAHRMQRRVRQSYKYPLTGAEIVIGGMDKPTKVMSTEYDMIYVQEATELTENDWESLTTRLRNGRLPFQQLLADCNPDRPTHWLKRRVDTGKTAMLESRHTDNPVLWDEATGDWTARGKVYIAKLDALTGARYWRLRHGRWVQSEGVVYEDWESTKHVLLPEDAASLVAKNTINRANVSLVFASIDWGYTHAGVLQCWLADKDGRLYLFHEVYKTHETVEWWVQRAKELHAQYRFQAVVCDPSQPAHIEQMRRAGVPAREANNDVRLGISKVQERLKLAGDGMPRLFVLSNCTSEIDQHLEDDKLPTGILQEIDGYVWANKAAKEEPVKENDHGVDALRYAVMYAEKPKSNGGIWV